jgi:hypothetical protein
MVKTLTFRLDTPDDRTLHLPLPPDVPDGPLEVVLVIAPVTPATATPSLAGRWQAYFPPDFDINSALREIRGEWEKEWSEDE